MILRTGNKEREKAKLRRASFVVRCASSITRNTHLFSITNDLEETSSVLVSSNRIRKSRTQYAIRNTKKGLTLIEVLLAVSILAIGVIGVLRGYASSIATLHIGQYTIDASGLLKQKITDVEQMILEEEEISLKSDSGTFESPFEEFLWQWEIKPVETEGLNRLTLIVSHQSNPRTFRLNTYVVDKSIEKEED